MGRVALLAGEKVLSEASPAKDLAPGGKVECDLTLPASAPADGLVLRLETAVVAATAIVKAQRRLF